MRELLKKETTFNLTPECTKEFEDLKTALISKPILGAINENNDIYVTVDGSKLGLGGSYFKNDQMPKNIRVLINQAQRQKVNKIGHFMP